MMILPTATTPTSQAILTRAFFLQRSQGPFNSLFTGEGERKSFLYFFFFSRARCLSPSLSKIWLSLLSFPMRKRIETTTKIKRQRLHRHRRRLCRRVDRVPVLALLLQVAATEGEGHHPLLSQRGQRRRADERELRDADASLAVI